MSLSIGQLRLLVSGLLMRRGGEGKKSLEFLAVVDSTVIIFIHASLQNDHIT
jgi:hypothetical protein